MKHHLITGIILAIALALYGYGLSGLGAAAFIAGGLFELWFWWRILE